MTISVVSAGKSGIVFCSGSRIAIQKMNHPDVEAKGRNSRFKP